MERDLLHDDFDIDERIEADTDIIEPDRPAPASYGPPPGAPPRGNAPQGERFEERRFTGGDTLNEPVLTTLQRDIKASWNILRHTLTYGPQSDRPEWDLWGPLVFCLILSLVLSITSSGASSKVFSSVFAIVWLGQALVVFNIRLLGGTISYLHALSVTGYSLFPLVVAALFSWIVKQELVRLVVAVLMIAWATLSASRSLGSAGVVPSRVALASYPVGLFYFVLGWMCVVV